MTLSPPPTIESFYKFCGEKKLMGVKCSRCKKVTVPPRGICSHCRSTDVSWIELPSEGRLVTYTVIHVAPPQFQTLVPYAIGVVEFGDRTRLPGMVKDIDLKDLKVGMELQTDFESTTPNEWPRWPRYFFRKTELNQP
jgi:uncharacterized OB-fold protein